ncbi:MAG: primosomal protein N' [Rickettsiales bacterium]|nr:MAG: primosomal protein N' [Rickettsiales bacterium]
MHQIIKVLLPQVCLFPLDYSSDTDHNIGDLIVVPFRNKELTGIVWEIGCADSGKALKNICSPPLFPASINPPMIELITRASSYYLADLGTIAKLVLPVNINESPLKIKTHDEQASTPRALPPLTPSQQEALGIVKASILPVVIKGVTGSGKTELYFHAIQEQLALGKQALIMLPEIALGSQIIARFTERFGFEPAIWNSKVTKAQKKQILRGIISGSVKIVIGARSSLFLPYKELGMIVVDEEHDSSYKQGEGILYHARDMAVLRGAVEGCKILLGSATPSIESLYNVQIGKYQLATLNDRWSGAFLPDVKIVDMRNESLGHNCYLSEEATLAIGKNLAAKNQTLIFLNRRGYAPLMLCKACGYRFDCKSCSASMVVHKSSGRMECHHCGAVSRVHDKCPDCQEENTLTLCGAGIERVAEEVSNLFPNSNTSLVSKEEFSCLEKMKELLSRMESGEIDILIGTQIVTKGYHFPNLTLVVVANSDIGFMGGDLRTAERTYQLLHQVGGRAGRADKKGSVLLQTYYPEHKVITAIASGTEDEFIRQEIASREQAKVPPFAKMAAITITGKNPARTLIAAKDFVAKAPKSTAQILGPAEAAMLKLSGRYRYRILVIADKKFNLQKYLTLWREHAALRSTYQLKIDIDPQSTI